MRDDRHREGEDAFLKGRSFSDNPYCRVTRASRQWSMGWAHAERDIDDGDDDNVTAPRDHVRLQKPRLLKRFCGAQSSVEMVTGRRD